MLNLIIKKKQFENIFIYKNIFLKKNDYFNYINNKLMINSKKKKILKILLINYKFWIYKIPFKNYFFLKLFFFNIKFNFTDLIFRFNFFYKKKNPILKKFYIIKNKRFKFYLFLIINYYKFFNYNVKFKIYQLFNILISYDSVFIYKFFKNIIYKLN